MNNNLNKVCQGVANCITIRIYGKNATENIAMSTGLKDFERMVPTLRVKLVEMALFYLSNKDEAEGFDILGQLSNITQTLNGQGRYETWKNNIPRYGMIRLIYRLDIRPKEH